MRASNGNRVRNAVKIAVCGLLLAAPVATAATLGSNSAGAQTPTDQNGTVTQTTPTDTGGQAAATSKPAPTRLVVKRRRRYALDGRTIRVRGRLSPDPRHAKIVLQQRRQQRWVTVARARTGAHGDFTVRYRVRTDARVRLRVRFDGTRTDRPSVAALGQVVGFVRDVASWYYDAGGTACGFHASYGVANRTLPCGTKVTFKYGGRILTATVDDRGPYVAGRTYDLSQTTAQALGMSGVQTVEASL